MAQDLDTEEREATSVPTLTCIEKLWLYIISAIFAVVAILSSLEKIKLSVGNLLALIIAVVFSSWFIVPKAVGLLIRYVKSIKFGGLEITLKDQQSDINKRLTILENKLLDNTNSIKGAPDSQLIANFESAARSFRGPIESRISAVTKMEYYGVQLGVEYLIDKLQNGFLGEQVGSASALGVLGDRTSLDCLLKALNNESSYVRYRAAMSIKRLKELSIDEKNKAVNTLKEIVNYESNIQTKQTMQQAIVSLQKI